MEKFKSEIWLHYKKLPGDRYECKFCKMIYKQNATRQLKHTLDCNNVPEDIKKNLKKPQKVKSKTSNIEINDNSDTLDDDLDDIILCSPEKINLPKKKEKCVKNTKSVKGFFDHITDDEQEVLENLMARAIFASGSSLNLFEKKEWQDFFKRLRPSFVMPSRYKISNPLLENEFTRVQSIVEEKLNSASVLSLQTDAWSNIRNDSITNYMINTPEPIFFKTVHTKENRHTSAFLAREIITVMIENDADKFLGLVSDDGANIKNARKLVCEKFSWVIEYGCICHALNLLIEDILKLQSVDILKNQVTNIIKTIKNSHVLHATFERIQKSKKENSQISLKLPVKTRWNSFVSCLESMLKNKNPLQNMAIDENTDVQDIFKKNKTINKINRLLKGKI